MDQTDRKKIRRNLPALAKDMDFDIVSMGLQARFIFDNHHIQKFEANASKMKKNQTMLMELETRGPTAFKSLIECLVEADQGYLAKLLGYNQSSGGSAQASTPHEPKQAPFGQPAQQLQPMQQPTVPNQGNQGVWPAADAPSDLSTTSMQLDAGVPYQQTMVDSDMVYRMKSKPRGIALIINNKKFRTMKQRSGTDVDCRNLEHVCKQLGFNVVTHKDLKGKEIQQILYQISKHNHSQFDCFILAVLTHGVEGAVYGTDENLVKIEDMIALFSADLCPTLAGKPKVFLLQACRGERFDTGVESTDGTRVVSGAGEQAIQLEEDDIIQKMLHLELEGTDSFASARSKIPSQSDMLLAYATVPGYVSWRNSERGSWFIQALTEVFIQYAKQEDLLSMITMINSKVARAFESSSGRHKQMPAPVTMLTKKLYFFPGHYE